MKSAQVEFAISPGFLSVERQGMCLVFLNNCRLAYELTITQTSPLKRSLPYGPISRSSSTVASQTIGLD